MCYKCLILQILFFSLNIFLNDFGDTYLFYIVSVVNNNSGNIFANFIQNVPTQPKTAVSQATEKESTFSIAFSVSSEFLMLSQGTATKP